MLYIFSMDSGTMLTFDINLAMKSVQELQTVIAKDYKVPEDKQVLLISGGEHLDPEQRVCSYSSGTDTNPIFLFSKSTIESSCLPTMGAGYDNDISMKDKVEGALNMPPSYETVVTRAQLALQFHDVAREELKRCEQLVHDQHLQHQGWAAAVANLEDINSSFKNRMEIFRSNFEEYLVHREEHIETLSGFPVVVELLSRLPLLPSLIPVITSPTLEDTPSNGSSSAGSEMTVLDWIAAQDSKNSLDQMAEMCHKGIQQLDHHVMESLLDEVATVMENVNNPNMKEVKGLEDRLYKLEQLMFSARKLVQEQSEMSQGFVQNQSRAGNVRDNSIFPDLCASHRQQLLVMLKNHQRLKEAREKCAKAKDELCHNLHQRLRWIMYVEKNIYDVDGKLVIHHENLKRLKRRLEIIRHVHCAPQIYAAIVIEIHRRRDFKDQFMNWAIKLSADSDKLYKAEMTRRSNINDFVGQHFFRILFPGLSDCPAPFATECPEPFDMDLPLVTLDDITHLRDKVPELAQLLNIPETFDIVQHITSLQNSKEEPPTALEHSTDDIEIINNPDSSPRIPRQCHVDFERRTAEECQGGHNCVAKNPKAFSADSSKDSPIEVVTMADVADQTASNAQCDVTVTSPQKDVAEDDVTKQCTPATSGEHHTPLKTSASTGSSGSKREASLGGNSDNSGEFHTGVFYIDESMPSSMAESPQIKRLEEMQGQLDSKDQQLRTMEAQLDSCKSKLILVQEKLKTLYEVTERDTLKLKCDLLSTEKQIVRDKEEFSAYLDRVFGEITDAIGRASVEQNEERERILNSVKNEYENKICALQDLLSAEVEKSDQLHREIVQFKDVIEDLNSRIEKNRLEGEEKVKQCQNECEERVEALTKTFTLEHEVELERARSDLNTVIERLEGEVQELKDGLADKQTLIVKLQRQVEHVTETMSEQFQGEKEEIRKILEEQYANRQAMLLNEQEESAQKKIMEAVDKAAADLEKKHRHEFDELQAKFVELKEAELQGCRMALEALHHERIEQIQARYAHEKQQALDELRAAVSAEKELELGLVKSELESVKSSSQKVVQMAIESGEMMSQEEHIRVLDDLKEQLNANAQKKLDEALSDEHSRHERAMTELTEDLEQQKRDSLNSMKSNMAAEKQVKTTHSQVAFNEALNKVVVEKDKIIDELRRRENDLLAQLKAAQGGDLVDVKNDFMSQSQSVMTQSVIPIRECASESSADMMSSRIVELETKLRTKEEETSRLQSKLMELSMTHSTRTLMQHDKVSITTCNIGDLVLLCLDERHDHYVVFTVGTTLHFLHSDCLEALKLKTATGEQKKSWVLAEVTDKEYCQAKKPTNRFKVPVGTKFYRVKARPWNRETTSRDGGSSTRPTT